MDPILIEKLKQDFQNERREQVLKGKDLQKETLQRRRQMELKAQLEAAKEEKRRQEALAERKARHIEATMRFQKGLKHFKFNKEKISLEQVLRDITPQRSRLNSADDTDRTNNSNFNNYNYIDSNLNYFNHPSNKTINNNNNNNKNQSFNRLRKSSSFESLNSLINSNVNNANINNNNSIKKQFLNNSNPKLNISSQQKIIVEPLKLNHMNQSNISQHLNAYNPETLIENTNFKIINNHQTKNIVYNPNVQPQQINSNQQQHHPDLAKDHLKEFQNLVANELQISKQPKIVKPNPNQTFYDTTNILTIEDYKNGVHHQQYNNNLRQSDDIDDDNSMDTDSLLNIKIDSASTESSKQNVSTANKIDGENDINDDILFINNNIKKKEPFKNQLNTNYNSHVDASNLWFNNNNNNSKTQKQNQNLKNSQPLNHHQQQNQQTNFQSSTNRNNSLGNIKENTTKEIKSILKRSSSLENNSTLVAANTSGQGVNFAVKPSSETNVKNVGVKDSIELANMRLKKEDSSADITTNKKSVRFASHLNDFNDGAQTQSESINSNSNTNNNNNSNQPEVKQTTQQQTPTNEDQRISSTNSIRRPVIKPRNATVNSYNRTTNQTTNGAINLKNDADIVTTTTIVNSPKFLNHPTIHHVNHKIDEFIVNSEKPPAYPNSHLLSGGSSSSTSGGSSSYSLIGQKRRELLQQRNKLNSGGSSSCSSSAGTGSGSSGLNERLILNSPKTNGINIKIDVSPSINQQQYYAPSSNNSITTNNNNPSVVLPLNRINLTSPSPLQSPNTFFPMPISNSSQSSSSFSNSNNSNNNFTNLKYVEGNYREYQLAKNKEHSHQPKNTPTSNDTTIRLNNNTVIDMNLYKKLDISNYLDQQHQLNQMINRELYAPTTNNNNQQTNITRIPLSPKSNLKPNNYYHPNSENLLINKPVNNNNNNSSTPDQIVLRRPAVVTDNNNNNQSSFTSKPPTPSNNNHTPNATVAQLMSPAPTIINNTINNGNFSNNNNNNVPKTNIRFAYINSPLSSNNNNINNNQTNYYNESQIKAHLANTNTSSAESVTNGYNNNNNNNNKIINSPIHLEIKYPLYSNHQQAPNAQYINITRPINKQPSFESDPSQRNGIPVSISIEEQNVKNSIMRLNERLNMITNQRQYNNPSDYISKTNFEFNKQKPAVNRQITTNATKIRR